MGPLKLALGQEVVDRTGLTGKFDYYVRLPWPSAKETDDAANVSIFTAVQEQLAMKLERDEITWDLFVVERVSHPIPN